MLQVEAQRRKKIFRKTEFFYNLWCWLSSEYYPVLYQDFKDSTDRRIIFVIVVALQPRIPHSPCRVLGKQLLPFERIIDLNTHRQLSAFIPQPPMSIDWLPEMSFCF